MNSDPPLNPLPNPYIFKSCQYLFKKPFYKNIWEEMLKYVKSGIKNYLRLKSLVKPRIMRLTRNFVILISVKSFEHYVSANILVQITSKCLYPRVTSAPK